jgi:hypothetical protein
LLFTRVETVSQSSHADEDPRLSRVALDLLAQARDLVVDDPFGDSQTAPPDLVQQLFAGEQPPAIANQRA